MTDQQDTTAGRRRPHPAVDRSAAQDYRRADGHGRGQRVRPVAARTVAAGPAAPGALSAAQLNLTASSVASQRQSIAAMQAQLRVFDEQLAMLEGIIGPLAEWSKTWAEFEGLVMNARRDPGPES